MWPGGLLNYDDYPCSKTVPDVLRSVALMSILGFTIFIRSNCVAVRTTLIIALAWSVKIYHLDNFLADLGCQLVFYVFCSIKWEKLKKKRQKSNFVVTSSVHYAKVVKTGFEVVNFDK